MAAIMAQARHTTLPPPLNTFNSDVVDDVKPTMSDMSGQTLSSSSSGSRPSITVAPESDGPRGPTPVPTSTMVNGRIYSLDIKQQPIRARMCGFGDKDRRPITPPPCIRLVVVDEVTRQELDINDIDTAYLVLTVDLWSADAQKEVNLVRHSSTSPSISATTASAYPPPNDEIPTAPAYAMNVPLQAVHIPETIRVGTPQQQQVSNAYAQANPGYSSHNYYPQSSPQGPLPPPPVPLSAGQSGYYKSSTPTPNTPTGSYGQQLNSQGPLLSPAMSCDPRSHPSGMFTRNLIGSLCVSAFKLTDCDNRMGVWFILQDLSVRTEGSFRLKMNFVNVGSPTAEHKLNTASAPVLASCYSEIFQVFSAKKFPGVIESTNLSKCFATQGIKIPIRKDGPRGNERRHGDGDDDD